MEPQIQSETIAGITVEYFDEEIEELIGIEPDPTPADEKTIPQNWGIHADLD